MDEFKALVRRMREAQKKYHKAIKYSDAQTVALKEAVKLEKQVDAELHAELHPPVKQEELFGEVAN